MTSALGAVVDRWRETARRDWLFLVTLGVGFALRVVAQVAYRPALLYIDSFRYLKDLNFDPTKSEPVGYPVMVLRPLLFLFGNLVSVAALQHVLGLAMGVAIYVLLRRRGARPWLAAVATMPVLLNAYQIQIEQNVLAETVFEVLIVAGVVALLWNPEPKLTALIASGTVLGMAVTVRTVGLPLVLPAVVYAAVAGPSGWGRAVRSVVVTAAFLLPVTIYVGYYHHWSQRVGLTTADAAVLAGRAEVIVDCRGLSLPSYEQVLCPTEPLGHRRGTDEYAHDAHTPISHLVPPAGQTRDQVLRDFARRVFEHQPLDLAHVVFDDFAKNFALSPTTSHGDRAVSRWQFQRSYPSFPGMNAAETFAEHGGGGPSVVHPLTAFLRDYQLTVGFVPGPALAAMFVLGLAGGVGLGRARRSGLRAACLLPTATGLLVLVAADFFEFSWRYQLPALAVAPIGAALGIVALTGRDTPRPGGPGHVLDASRPGSSTAAPVGVA
ncbi:MAG TPA: phospholipid carrier-dependent glycosyltransferase [Acidimicrobiia bacterium]